MDKSTRVFSVRFARAAALLVICCWGWISPLQAAVTRFEETDASVSYTVGWSQGDSSRPWSGGTAATSTAPGAQATFTFTGPAVSWIGGRTPGTGIVRISLDGVFVTEVDTYSKTEEIRVPMFEATGLANASHTLTIEVTGRKNAAATSTLVVVDAFDVPAATISRLQETDPSVTYTAGWVQDNPVVTLIPGITTDRTQGSSLRSWSAGAAMLSTTPGAQATFSFTGTAISWVGARGNQSGIARVSLDGVFVAEVDMYSATEQIQAAVFTATGLADASHTLLIEVTGRQNAASTSALVVVDAFDVTSSGTRHQETDPAITYGTGWIMGNRDKAYSEGATAETNTLGAQATITFTGTGIGWVGARGPQTGKARIYLDRVFVEEVDTYAPTEGPQHTDFTATGLAAGTHTLTIEVSGRNPLSTDIWILIDAFDVTP
jgi:predicted RNA-binding protein with PIN domain